MEQFSNVFCIINGVPEIPEFYSISLPDSLSLAPLQFYVVLLSILYGTIYFGPLFLTNFQSHRSSVFVFFILFSVIFSLPQVNFFNLFCNEKLPIMEKGEFFSCPDNVIEDGLLI